MRQHPSMCLSQARPSLSERGQRGRSPPRSCGRAQGRCARRAQHDQHGYADVPRERSRHRAGGALARRTRAADGADRHCHLAWGLAKQSRAFPPARQGISANASYFPGCADGHDRHRVCRYTRASDGKDRRRERDQSEIPPASAFFTYGFRTFEKGARAVNTIGRALAFFFRAAPPLFFPSWGRGVA